MTRSNSFIDKIINTVKSRTREVHYNAVTAIRLSPNAERTNNKIIKWRRDKWPDRMTQLDFFCYILLKYGSMHSSRLSVRGETRVMRTNKTDIGAVLDYVNKFRDKKSIRMVSKI